MQAKQETGEIGELLDQIDDRSLDAWQKEFITGLRERYEEYGERVKLSPKQWEKLREIAGG